MLEESGTDTIEHQLGNLISIIDPSSPDTISCIGDGGVFTQGGEISPPLFLLLSFEL